MPGPGSRYTATAIVLHWAIALALLGNAALGWWMADAIDESQTQLRAITAFQLHKSLGLTVLGLSLLRLAWRLLHPPPAFPPAMPRWERVAATAAHWGFYVLMIGLPLSGWLYVSSQWRDGGPINVPTLWFGWFEVPHLFGLQRAADATREMVSGNAGATHGRLAWLMAGLLVLHVAAALKHQFHDRDEVLRRMLPGWQRGEWERGAALLTGAAAMLVLVLAVVQPLLRAPVAPLAFSLVDELPAQRRVQTSGRWIFSPDHGSVQFSGRHAGAAFNGEFTRWTATLALDPENLGAARLSAEIETASATDGVPLHDQTLPQREWFDVRRHPLATFRSTTVRPDDEGYRIEGVLTIKGRYLPVGLSLQLDAQGAHVDGRFDVDRTAADLGMESDPAADYVSKTIRVRVRAAGLPH